MGINHRRINAPVMKLDLTDQAAVRRFFKEECPDYVFMAATKVSGLQANWETLDSFLYLNALIEFNTTVVSLEWRLAVTLEEDLERTYANYLANKDYYRS